MGDYLWLLYALLCALTLSLTDLITKKYGSDFTTLELALSRMVSAVPVMLLFCLYNGIPAIDPRIVPVLILAAPLEVLAIILYVRAITQSELSVTVPLLSLTPAFLLLTSPLIVGEVPSFPGLIGVICIIAGNYLVQLDRKHHGIMAPFKQLLTSKGPRYMFIVAFLYSITSNLARYGINYSDAVFFATVLISSIALLLVIISAGRPGSLKKILTWKMVPLGLISALVITFHMLALRLTLVTYMISVKRSSLLFSIILGALVFKEKGLGKKLVGGVIILAGIVVIALAG